MSIPYTIGVAGHVDHGKTTLVRYLTGVDTDRKAEEKARGLSIESGVARLRLPGDRNVALIDVPGHTDFLKNTIRGLHGVDMALLVVAADDGVMPQTRDHLEILNFFQASAGMVILSKTDLVDKETVELARMELADLLDDTFLHHSPVVQFSHKEPERIPRIIQEIDQALNRISAKKTDGPFRLWIDQVKSIKGHGTVVSGTICSGLIVCNDEIEILPAGIKTRARSLESHGCQVSRAVAGQRVGINLHNVALGDVRRGMMLGAPAQIEAVYLLNAEIRVLAWSRQVIKNRQRVKIYLGTSITSAMIVLMDRQRLEPGETGLAQIRLMRPVAALPRDCFVISPLNLNSVMAGGRVLATSREKFRAVKSDAVLPALEALHADDVDAFLQCVFAHARGSLITAGMLAQETGLPALVFERYINAKVQKGTWVYIKGHGAIDKEHLSMLKEACKKVFFQAFEKNPLRKNVTLGEVAERLEFPVEASLLKTATGMLCAEGHLAPHEGGYILHGRQAAMDSDREALISELLAYARETGLTPFSADTFWKHHQRRYDKSDIRQVLNYLFSRKQLIRLNDQRFLSLEAMEEIKTRVVRTLEKKSFVTVNDCKELFGFGRWGGTHVLDYLNEIGFTQRREDKHYLVTSGRG